MFGRIRGDLTVVGSPWRLVGVALQQQIVLRHQPIDPFMVQPGRSCALTLSIEQSLDSTIPVRRPIIGQCTDRG
jgi:hypothetical protein